MGQGKIDIVKLEPLSARIAKFKKRSNGVINKAWEISILCDIDVGVVLFNPEGKPPTVYSTNKTFKDVATKLEDSNYTDTNREEIKMATHNLYSMDQLNLCSMDQLNAMKSNLQETRQKIDERMYLLCLEHEGEKTDLSLLEPILEPKSNEDGLDLFAEYLNDMQTEN